MPDEPGLVTVHLPDRTIQLPMTAGGGIPMRDIAEAVTGDPTTPLIVAGVPAFGRRSVDAPVPAPVVAIVPIRAGHDGSEAMTFSVSVPLAAGTQEVRFD